MTNALTAFTDDPAEIGYPPTLPIEVALNVAPISEICEAHGISRERWNALRQDPVFVTELSKTVEVLKKEGMSFKMKARLQAEELLKTSWQLIHGGDDIPATVKADLIKFTIKAAGLDASKEQAANAGQQNALQININLA